MMQEALHPQSVHPLQDALLITVNPHETARGV